MLNKDPSERWSAEQYMISQKGKAFPDYFYTFLKLYLQRFASARVIGADERIARVRRDLPLLYAKLNIKDGRDGQNESLLLIASLLTSALRNLRLEKSKLLALDMLVELSHRLLPELVLDRVLPYVLFMTHDTLPSVRAAALRSITQTIVNIESVPLSDANIFPEYLLPEISHLTNDPVVAVRLVYAENIAALATTALRFLEISQLSGDSEQLHGGRDGELGQRNCAYQAELQSLHEMVQLTVVTLLRDS